MDNTNATSASPFSSVASPVIRPRVAETSDREIPIEVVSDSLPLHPSVVEPPIASRSENIDRLLNVFIASTALVLASPVMLIVAGLIKLTSRGPIFYSQARVGINRRLLDGDQASYDRRARNLGGRPFLIYKFRTMQLGAEKSNGAVWATPSDSRVTAVGRILRKYRIDEFPQLINVIRGDMNIVGPRPERPSIFSRLCNDIADYPLRQNAKPGITGWAQVNHGYDESVDDVRTKVRYDLEYIQRQGVAEDLKIMAKTLPVILFRRGGW